jgi:hypothetical protein
MKRPEDRRMSRLWTASSSLLLAIGILAASPAWARIQLPWIAQKTPTDCGRAVLASLAARRGGSAEASYARIRDPSDRVNGYSIDEMRRVGRSVGVNLTVVLPTGLTIMGDCGATPAVDAHFKRLAELVAGGTPVVVPITAASAGHYLILIGAIDSGFTAHDPASPGQRSMSREQLKARMCRFGYVALVAR